MKLLWYILIGAILGIIVGIFDLPSYLIWVVMAIAFIVITGTGLYTLFGTQNLTKLDRFIKKNNKNPIYKSLEMLAHGNDEQFKESLEDILKKYKNTKYEANYGAMLAMLNGDFEEAHRYNARQLQTEVGQYTAYIINILDGKEVGDAPAFKKSWMNFSIEAHKALMRNDLQTFEVTSQQAINLAKGIQHYGNYYTFKRMKRHFLQQ